MKRIYLDNNATTPVLPEVLEAMAPYWSGEFGNASSLHQEGQLARRALESARESVAECLEVQPSHVIFTSGGTESNNLAIHTLNGRRTGRIVTTPVEHPSVLECLESLERSGTELHRLPVDMHGAVSADDFTTALADPTQFACVMLVNNETGTLQPMAELAAEARRRGVPLHTDAVQAVGRIPVSFRKLGVHSLSLSAHKFHGPKGVGALLVDPHERLRPLLCGGNQEAGMRPGTPPVALIAGMARALELATRSIESDLARVRQLRTRFELGLRRQVHRMVINGCDSRAVPYTLNVRIPELDAQSALLALDLAGLACSTGSACASGAPTPSHVLLAMGLREHEARSSLRFSLNRFTTEREVDRAIELVTQVVEQQKKQAFSPSSASSRR